MTPGNPGSAVGMMRWADLVLQSRLVWPKLRRNHVVLRHLVMAVPQYAFRSFPTEEVAQVGSVFLVPTCIEYNARNFLHGDFSL